MKKYLVAIYYSNKLLVQFHSNNTTKDILITEAIEKFNRFKYIPFYAKELPYLNAKYNLNVKLWERNKIQSHENTIVL